MDVACAFSAIQNWGFVSFVMPDGFLPANRLFLNHRLESSGDCQLLERRQMGVPVECASWMFQ